MSLQIPVVAAAVGGLPELIGRNERGLLVDDHCPLHWAQAIREVLGAKDGTLARIEAACTFAGGNGVAAMSKAYLSEYEKVLAQANLARQSAVLSQLR